MDLDADGFVDLLSGSWPGELFWFKGAAKRAFAAPRMIQDRRGAYINIGGGISEDRDGGILITGNADFVTTDEGTFVEYHGKRIESTPDKPVSVTGTASAVYAADWDGDGDLDLIVGDIRGRVHLVRNEGTASKPLYGKEQRLRTADGQAIHVAGDAGPHVCDWDGDGDLDLLVGAGDGSVALFSNLGVSGGRGRSPAERGLPKLAASKEIVGPGKVSYQDPPKHARRGTRSKVCTYDWNGDGKLDLLLGDYGIQAPDLPPLTKEEQAKEDLVRDRLQRLQKEWSSYIPKIHGPNRERDKEKLLAVNKKMGELTEQMQQLRKQVRPQTVTHGWVWLFIRK